MALQIHCPSPFTLTLTRSPLRRSNFAVKSQSESSSDSDAGAEAQPKKLGFGPATASPAPAKEASKKKLKGKRQRASIIRRSPLDNPAFSAAQSTPEDEEKAKELGQNESAFVLAWLGLGAIILAEGIALAASGFLPEEWDKLFVKYLYPSFTPTVGLFIAGTVAYGVSKYLQNEKLKQ